MCDNCTQNAYLFVFVYAHCLVNVGPLSRDLTRHLEVPHSLPSHSRFFSPRAGPSLPPQLFPAAVEPSPHRGLVCKSSLLSFPRLLTSLSVLLFLPTLVLPAGWQSGTEQLPRPIPEAAARGQPAGVGEAGCGRGGAALPCCHGRCQCPRS